MNIIFDLGGVVIAWRPDEIVAKAFPDPAMQQLVRREIMAHPDWLELDRGTLSWESAIVRGAERTGLSHATVAAFLYSVPPALVAIRETVELLYRLRARGYTLFCLSNMPTVSMEHLQHTYSFWDVFTGMVISSRLGLCKPERAIYEHLLETYALDPADTVFVDDVEANLAAARELGIRTIKFEDAAQCEAELRALGCE